jgi:hypothetical protein
MRKGSKQRSSARPPKLERILQDVADAENTLPLEDRRSQLAALLRFDANLTEPIHRWFKFKESFSGGLVKHLLHEFPPTRYRGVRFLDPFCGVGTSLLAADEAFAEMGLPRPRLRGIEVNPYVAFVARTKLDWHSYDPAALMRAASVSLNGVKLGRTPTIPKLSTFHDPRFIEPEDLSRLLDLRDKVRMVARRRREQRPLLVGLAAAAEQIFHLRKDGRALRFTPRPDRVSVTEAVSATWNGIAEDLQISPRRSAPDHRVLLGDGRRADDELGRQRFDVILFSPPYLNNIDYTEVYKLELWLLEFIRSPKAMVTQRKRTFRSHPSCIFPSYSDATFAEVIRLLGPAFRRLLDHASGEHKWRRRLFAGYFADTLRTLRGCRKLLAENGRVFLITGNSLHGTAVHPVPVATDVWTALVARAAGLRVDKILVGRDLPRRTLPGTLLRESILVLSHGERRR